MFALSRLFLFGSAWITIFFLSALVQKTHENSGSAILENFHGASFLFVALALSSWIYFVHFKEKNGVPRDLKEVLYIFTFVCGFTSVAAFLGYC